MHYSHNKLDSGAWIEEATKECLAIRNTVTYVRSSPNRLESFKKVVEGENFHVGGWCAWMSQQGGIPPN